MIYYCSEFAPFTNVQHKHLQQLMKEEHEVGILFLNVIFETTETDLYFQAIFAEFDTELPYIQVAQDALEGIEDPIYFDGLLEERLQSKFSKGTFLPVSQKYGYELLPFVQTHVFDDVSKTIADFIIEDQLFGINEDMQRVYYHISYGRFQHTMRVRYLVTQLAKKHQLNMKDAQFAALFHDYAKEMPQTELEAIMQSDFPEYLDAPGPTWHGFVGAKMVEDLYGASVRRNNIYEAIEFHSVGIPHYSELGLALFIADFCDYRRSFTDETIKVWEMAQDSLYEGARAKVLALTTYFAKSQKQIYRTTQNMLTWLTEELR